MTPRLGPRDGTSRDVREFWEAESCGERYFPDGRVNFADADEARYMLEPMIGEFARFDDPFDGVGVEIGLGLGGDHERLRKRGGTWIGVDLTSRALEHTAQRVGKGSLTQADAERLPIQDCSVDLVYSWGVLLCCPNITAAIAEVHRVLRPGGEARIMLYHTYSWVALAAWLRWGIVHGVGLKRAVSYMESPGTQAFSVTEAPRLLEPFAKVDIETVHTTWDEKWFGPIGRIGGNRLGWFLLCHAVK